MRETVFLAEMSRADYQARVDNGAVVLVPAGATEQHGNHLPLGVDHLLVTEVCRRVAEQVQGVVVPTLTFGYKSQPRSGGGNFHGGNIALDGNTLSLLLRDVLREIAKGGARKIAVIDGHFENAWFLTEGCDLALREFKREGYDEVKIVKMMYGDGITQKTLDIIFPDHYPGIDLEHAAVLETSMMLYLFPDLVDMDLVHDHGLADFPDYDVYPADPDWIPPSGALAPAERSSVEFGRMLIEEAVELISEALNKELQGD